MTVRGGGAACRLHGEKRSGRQEAMGSDPQGALRFHDNGNTVASTDAH
jgi:hypothetical protein